MTKRKPSPYSYTQTLSRYINAESYLFYVVSTYTGPHAKSSVPVIDMNHLFFFWIHDLLQGAHEPPSTRELDTQISLC